MYLAPTTKCFMDTPRVFDCAVTPIPGSGSPTIQVVASLKYKASRIQVRDAVGKWFEVFIGPVGFETPIGVVGGGVTSHLDVEVAARSRVSVRSSDGSPITTGTFSLTFLG